MADSGEPKGSRQCAFCGARRRLSREHVLAQWITEVLRDLEKDHGAPEWWTHYTAGGLVERDRHHPNAGLTVVIRTVCEACNNGWMASLEGRVKPLLEPMIRGQRTALDVEQQVDIAAWALKTAVALGFQEPTTTVTRREDRLLIRDQRRPPHHHRVRLAYRDEYMETVVSKTLVARSEDVATIVQMRSRRCWGRISDCPGLGRPRR